MKDSRISPLLWLRLSCIAGLLFALAQYFVLAVVAWSLTPKLVWCFFGASLGGALGSLHYRRLLGVPALTRQSLVLWLLSTAWGAPLMWASLQAFGHHALSDSVLLFKLGATFGLAAFVSLMCFMPLKWLQNT